jgi:small subunit ribosomal protein S3
MGHKVHPRVLRTGVIYGWDSKWFAGKQQFARLLKEDIQIKDFLKKKLKEGAVDHIGIERTPRAVTFTIHTGKPGVVIGRGGAGIEDLKKQLRRMLMRKDGTKLAVNLNVVEVTNPSMSAMLVAQSMIGELERRMPFRRVLKQHLERVQKAGAKGVRLVVSGRLNGAEIARVEKLTWGSVPLHNLRADIDYASEPARTIAGAIGVKCWIYKGDVFDKDISKAPAAAAPAPRREPSRAPARRPRA